MEYLDPRHSQGWFDAEDDFHWFFVVVYLVCLYMICAWASTYAVKHTIVHRYTHVRTISTDIVYICIQCSYMHNMQYLLIYIHVYVCIHRCTYMHICIRIHIWITVYTSIYIPYLCMRICACTYGYIHMTTYIHIYTYTCVHICNIRIYPVLMYTQMYISICIYITWDEHYVYMYMKCI